MQVEHNYRLGVLGLLALPELQKENAANSTGNMALQDQQAALAFVYRCVPCVSWLSASAVELSAPSCLPACLSACLSVYLSVCLHEITSHSHRNIAQFTGNPKVSNTLNKPYFLLTILISLRNTLDFCSPCVFG